MSNTEAANISRHTPRKFILFTLVAAVVASFAAWGSATLALEVWVMFAGFIAWFTRPTSFNESLSAMLCLWLGIGLGAVAEVTTGSLVPSLGGLALPVVVFFVAILIVGLRSTPIVNNMLAWFLGMVTFFAAGWEISPPTFLHLVGATAIGGFAGWACQAINRRWVER
ncbi:DUF1097 domain-containing protein [Rhizobium sp. BT-175]|uniref:DUF1097 domain-containing protein n=1 Tax=Rhizobium sp. BT-175 TaxID=2986929 RepID=UPI0022363F37|nr:DUF1097 domain-containing protein [Rhizobium sp. BT-175]MCV9947599.1 DUF1097 domain-containing protein [Rhizobium sp. BT-175]